MKIFDSSNKKTKNKKQIKNIKNQKMAQWRIG